MPRIRSLKPEFWQDSRMARLPALERLVFLCTWSMADDEGRIEGDAMTVWRFGSFREDSREVARVLEVLRGLGRLVLYEVAGNPYIQIVNFTKHQRIDHASKSKYPEPSKDCDLLQESSRVIRESSRILAPDLEQGAGIKEGKDTVGLPPDADPPAKLNGHNRETRKHALAVLSFLNEKTGRNYLPVAANVDMIVARLKDGATVGDCRAVVAKKCREWGADEKMNEYLRPATLFNRTKFAQYVGEIAPEVEQ